MILQLRRRTEHFRLYYALSFLKTPCLKQLPQLSLLTKIALLPLTFPWQTARDHTHRQTTRLLLHYLPLH